MEKIRRQLRKQAKKIDKAFTTNVDEDIEEENDK